MEIIISFNNSPTIEQINWIIDRNLAVCYLIVDEMHQDYPQLVKDQYWDDVAPNPDEKNWPEASTAKLMPLGPAATKIVPSLKVLYVSHEYVRSRKSLTLSISLVHQIWT